MSDTAFLLEVLSDGEPHSLNEILRRSFQERGCGLTVHSRAADLRKQGYVVSNTSDPFVKSSSVYRLLRQGGERPAAGVSASPPSRSTSLPDAGPVTSPEEIGPASPYQLSIEEGMAA